VQFAQRHHAGLQQSLHRGTGVRGLPVNEMTRAERADSTFDIEQIFEDNRQAMQRAQRQTGGALLIGVPMGVYTGLYRNSWLSRFFLTFSLIGVSLPVFLIGILLILVFAVWLGLLPSFGRGDTVKLGWWSTGFLTWSGLKALVLPSITLGLFQLTLIMRLVRAEMLEVLRTDYIKFARARGLPNRAVHFGHALKNTLVPVITIVGLQLGAIIAFAIVTETVFQWPGMGLLFIQSVNQADIPVMAAYLLLISALFVTINLIVDLLYYAVDPRLRLGRGQGAH
jgi:peptide/nickel transport system permease protein